MGDNTSNLNASVPSDDKANYITMDDLNEGNYLRSSSPKESQIWSINALKNAIIFVFLYSIKMTRTEFFLTISWFHLKILIWHMQGMVVSFNYKVPLSWRVTYHNHSFTFEQSDFGVSHICKKYFWKIGIVGLFGEILPGNVWVIILVWGKVIFLVPLTV